MSENEQKYDTDGNWCGGMTCAACVRRVENGLRKLPSVVDASVNLATERASVQFDHLPSVEEKQAVQEAIRKLGYEPLSLQQKSEQKTKRDEETHRLLKTVPGFRNLHRSTCRPCDGPNAFFEHHELNDDLAPDGAMELDHAWPSNTSAILLWWSLLRLGAKSLFSSSPDMNALILLGTLSAFSYSSVVTIFS